MEGQQAETSAKSTTFLERLQAVDRHPFPVEKLDEFKVTSAINGETVPLATYEFPAVGEPKALLFYLHGYGFGVYKDAYIFKRLAEEGIATHSFDRKGFGKSGGKRGLVESDQIEDHLKFIDYVIETKGYPKDIPKFLIGNSMGGLYSAKLLQERPDFFAGAILIVPAFGSYQDIPEEALNQIREVAKVDPHFKLEMPPRPEMAEIAEGIAKVFMDEYAYPFFHAGSMLTNHLLQEEINANMKNVKTPVLFLIGEKDVVVGNHHAKTAFDAIPIDDKEYKVYEGEGHMMLQEDEKYQRIQNDTLDFIKKHI